MSVESKVQDILADGILDCIRKPFTYDQLQQKISTLFSTDESTLEDNSAGTW